MYRGGIGGTEVEAPLDGWGSTAPVALASTGGVNGWTNGDTFVRGPGSGV